MSLLRGASCCAAVVLLSSTMWGNLASTRAAAATVSPRARLVGVEIGRHGVGFEVRRDTNPGRPDRRDSDGRRALAVWYPADVADTRRGLDALDYRLLDQPAPPVDALRRSFAASEAAVLVASPHVGIVPLTTEQALASLSASGMAVRNVPWSPGKFPAVLILGGPDYLSTTAEVLASHGIVAVAPFRMQDGPRHDDDRPFSAFMEDALRDADWAIGELRTMSGVDAARVAALGHGGGGFQALLLAMHTGNVSALINIDAGNFSTRTNPRQLPFYRPGAVRVPYLYIASTETRTTQDLFGDFLEMTASDRFEVVLQEPALRHHDLSDLGRGVTAIGLRGAAQGHVQATYAAVQKLIVRFLDDVWTKTDRRHAAFLPWLRAESAAKYSVTSHPATSTPP